MLLRQYRQAASLLALLILTTVAVAQPGTKGAVVEGNGSVASKGKTYALITGISSYEDPTTYHTLRYADADARAFYRYLVSPSGGKADPQNIDTLFNKQATKENFWKTLNSIKNRLQKNDLLYIYFSGHGDAFSSDLAYLLAYNAPPGGDRNNYLTDMGVINVHTLKSVIKIIIAGKGAGVVLITDACRTNELPPGQGEGRTQFFEQMYSKNAGEVQLISCLADQVSFEDARWGGGRGLFSWHLVNGLRGMADTKPADGTITLKELHTYVSDRVQEESYDPVTKKYRQTPDYCCREMDGLTVGEVDEATRQAVAAEIGGGDIAGSGPMLASAKGVNLSAAMHEAGYGTLYRTYSEKLEQGKLVKPAGDNAYDLLQQMLQANISDALKSDLKMDLGGRLMEDVTKVINTYLHASTNNNNYTYTYFMSAAEKLRAFRTIADTLYYNPADAQVNQLFLEGHANWHSYKTADLAASLKKVDSAIAIKPNAAYLYNLKGLMHLKLRQYEAARNALRTGIKLAPNWLYPYHNIASAYSYESRFDSALVYYRKALKIDPNYQTTYSGIASLYRQMDEIDSALYYTRIGLQKDPADPNLWALLGFLHETRGDRKASLHAFHSGIHADSTSFLNYEGVLMNYMAMNRFPDSLQYYVYKTIATDSTSPGVYTELGNIMVRNNHHELAEQLYDRALYYDSVNYDALKWKGYLCQAQQKYDLALQYMLQALRIDTMDAGLYDLLGKLYFEMDRREEALASMKKGITLMPKFATFYYNYGFVAAWYKDYKDAEVNLKKALQLDPTSNDARFQLARVAQLTADKKGAIKYLSQLTPRGTIQKADVLGDDAFEPIKDDAELLKAISHLE